MTARPFGLILLVAALATACSSTSPSTTTDAGSCGAEPVGATCRKSDGTCEALACVGATWSCPSGDTQVGLTPTSCEATDGGVDSGTPDSGACGEELAGETCKKPGGGCEAEICVGTTWTCPTGDTPIPLTATSCEISDGGSDAGSDAGSDDSTSDASSDSPVIGACGTPVATTIPLADGGTVVCYCEGACGCFTSPDAGTRCP